MAQTRKQQIGRWGENVAAYYLEKKGYQIIARNVRTPRGEIDLVALQNAPGRECLVFVEVKTRTNEHFGLPEEAVDERKLEHLFLTAEVYLEAYLRDHPEWNGRDWRIDVIAIQGRPGGKVEETEIEHFEHI